MNRIFRPEQQSATLSITLKKGEQTYVFKFRRKYAQQLIDVLSKSENISHLPGFTKNDAAVAIHLIRKVGNIEKKMKKIFEDDRPDTNNEFGPPEGY